MYAVCFLCVTCYMCCTRATCNNVICIYTSFLLNTAVIITGILLHFLSDVFSGGFVRRVQSGKELFFAIVVSFQLCVLLV